MGSKLRRATFVKALWHRQDSRQETPRYTLAGCSARGCRWPSLDEAQAPNAPVAKHEAKVTTCRMQTCQSFQRFLAKPFKKMFCCFFGPWRCKKCDVQADLITDSDIYVLWESCASSRPIVQVLGLHLVMLKLFNTHCSDGNSQVFVTVDPGSMQLCGSTHHP